MRGLLAVLILLVLISIGYALFISGGEQLDPDIRNTKEESVQQLENQAAIETAVEGSSAGEPTAQAERQSLPSASIPETEQGILLEVVYAETGEPAAGAKVYLRDYHAQSWQRHSKEIDPLPWWEKDLHILVPRFGIALSTDSDGRLRLPPTQPSADLYVQSEDAYSAEGRVTEAVEGKLRLELQPITEIMVLLLEKDGQPIRSTRLHIRSQERRRRFNVEHATFKPRSVGAVGWTNELGLARIRLPAASVAFGLDAWETFKLDMDSPFAQFPMPTFERRKDGLPITMQVEAGSMDLRLPPGIEAGEEPLLVRVQRDGYNDSAKRFLEGDRLLLQTLPLGHQFTAQLEHEDRHLAVTGAGPRRSGEVVVFELREWIGPPTLSFRLVDPEGAPMPGLDLYCEHFAHRSDEGIRDGWHHQSGFGSDELGQVRLAFEKDKDNLPHSVILYARGTGTRPMARLDLSGNYPPGVTDLGDVVMDLPPIVIAGRVVAVDGTPIPGANLNMSGTTRRGGKSVPVQLPQIRSGKDGHFVIRSMKKPSSMRPQGFKEGWYMQQIPQAVYGQEGVELVMERAGAVRARILHDLGFEALRGIRLECEDESLGFRAVGSRLEALEKGTWELTFSTVRPASYRLNLGLNPKVTIRSIPAILVGPGETTDLGDIDLRGEVEELSLRIVDASGKGIKDVDVRVDHVGSGWEPTSHSDGLGQVSILHWGERVDVTIDPWGGAVTRLEDFTVSQAVVLRQRRLQILLGRDLSFLGVRFHMILKIRPKNPSASNRSAWQGSSLGFNHVSKSAELFLPDVSELEVIWALYDWEKKVDAFRETHSMRLPAAGTELPDLILSEELLARMKQWVKESS